jgi:predicted DNA-binding transcriptional regulator AlpA
MGLRKAEENQKSPPHSPAIEVLLTARDVKQSLGCSLPLVYKMAERGQLPCVRWECPGDGTTKPRTMVRFRQSDVMRFIEDHYRN